MTMSLPLIIRRASPYGGSILARFGATVTLRDVKITDSETFNHRRARMAGLVAPQ